MEPFLRVWAEQVKREAAENRRLRNLEREAYAVKQLNRQRDFARRTKPLTDQITELMTSLPPSLRDRPWSMVELTARLQGKYRNHPHGQHVGQALKQLGWCRVRLYGEGFGGERVWVPSTYFSVDEASSVARRGQSKPPQ